MANTFKKIQTVTVGSGGATDITFSSIPATYTDLKIVLSGRSTQGNVYGGGALQFNGDTASNYRFRRLRADGSITASDNSTSSAFISNWDVAGANATASVFANIEFYIPNYTSANAKSVSIDYVGENNATEAHSGIIAGLWTGTAAITSIKLYSAGGNLVQYTTATLYGVANANTTTGGSGKATGGNQVYTDGTYWYHIFRSDGTFTPSTALNVDYLVVAGGGGGGGSYGGAGAGGGTRCTVGATGGGGSLESQLAVTATAYSITVGAGGAGNGSSGTVGSNSVFSTITSTGGGRGAQSNTIGGNGGSGGGGCGSGSGGSSGSVAGGSASPSGQGFNGGSGASSGSQPSGGGGGGAGAVGGNGSVGTGGAGGAGIQTSISGTATYYAGGGGGGCYNGTGGSGTLSTGGGTAGTGGTGGNATSAAANTGGGGGGSSGDSGGTGGSGIVIVRYAA